MTENEWHVLIERIRKRKCTPFLGAGVNSGIVSGAADIAKRWAAQFDYPLTDSSDLARVAQYLAVRFRDGLYPKDLFIDELEHTRTLSHKDFASDTFSCLRALAKLPFHIYITTNYDCLMTKALQHAGRNPERDVCRWNSQLRRTESIFDSKRGYEPADHNPLVFHLHGSDEIRQSLVLTEDDYLDFLINVSRTPRRIPPRIQQAMTDSSLLFVGYGLRDIDFRVVHRGLIHQLEGSLRPLSVSVQLDRGDIASKAYLESYFGDMNVSIYWGTADSFASELLQRWNIITGVNTRANYF